MTPLNGLLPLRQTSVWRGFREAVAIPHRYGRASGALLQYDQTRQRFVWADHPCEGIDTVLVGGQPIGGWAARNGVDSEGHAVCFVEIDRPLDEGVAPIARGRGKLHPRTGQRLANPADVVWDVLANIAGREVSESELARFRLDADRIGLVVDGSASSAADSVQAVVAAICNSVGATWSPDARGLCRLSFGAELDAAVATVDGSSDIAPRAALDDLANDLTVRFAWEDGAPRATLRVEAPASIRQFGRRVETLDATWISEPRVANDVARRILALRARPQWTIEIPGIQTGARVGGVVSLDHPLSPVTGRHLIVARSFNLETGVAALTVRAAVGPEPVVRLIQDSAAFSPLEYADATVSRQGEQSIVRLREDDGRPMAGASVTLDGRITRLSDAGGVVVFPSSAVAPGAHTLSIVTADGRRFSTTVEA